MSLSAAMEEAYSAGDEVGVVLTTVEIDHPAFDDPVRWVKGVDPSDDSEPVMLPIVEGGDPVAHTPSAFTMTKPGADRDGPTEGRIRLDGVTGRIYPIMKQALGYGQPISIGFRQYRVLPGHIGDVTGPDEEIAGLQLQSVVLTADAAEGTVAWPDGRKFNVPTGPNAFFDRETYPALFS